MYCQAWPLSQARLTHQTTCWISPFGYPSGNSSSPPNGTLQPSQSTSFSSHTYSSRNGTTVHMAIRARNEEFIPDSTLCLLHTPHQFPHSTFSMGHSLHFHGPVLEERSHLAPCPVSSPSIHFHTVARVLFHMQMQTHFRSCSCLKSSIETIVSGVRLLVCLLYRNIFDK